MCFFVLANPVTRGVRSKTGQHGFVALMRSEKGVGKEGFELDRLALGKQRIVERRAVSVHLYSRHYFL